MGLINQIPRWHVVSKDEYINNKDKIVDIDLYFINNTNEIYRGNTLYAPTVSFYDNSSELSTNPAIDRIYFNRDTLEGKVYNGDIWITIIKPLGEIDENNTDKPVSGKSVMDYVSDTLESYDNAVISKIEAVTQSKTDAEIEQFSKKNTSVSNPLSGKTIYVDGDSIAYGQGNKQTDGTYKSWADYIAENNDMILTKKAISGSKITNGNPSLQDRLSMITDDDYILISCMYNDYTNDVSFGTLSASIGNASDTDITVDGIILDINTFYGGLERLIRNVMINHPNSKFGFVITHKVANNWINPLDSSKIHTLKEYHDATIEVLEKYSIPYCDMAKYMNVLYNNPSLFVDAQMVHPNELGYKKYYVPHIEAWLKTL